MGMFDTFFKEKEATAAYSPTTEAEAWFNILHCCMRVDGDGADIELAMLVRIVSNMKLFGQNVDFEYYFPNITDLYEKYGNAQIVDCCIPKVSDGYGATLFSYCVDIVLADGNIEPEEQKFIEYLATKMNIPSDTASKIIEVALIRAKGTFTSKKINT